VNGGGQECWEAGVAWQGGGRQRAACSMGCKPAKDSCTSVPLCKRLAVSRCCRLLLGWVLGCSVFEVIAGRLPKTLSGPHLY